MTNRTSNSNRTFPRSSFAASFAAVALAAGLAGAGPTIEPEAMPEDESPGAEALEPVVMTADDLADAGWPGYEVEGLGSGDSIAVSPDGVFWMATLRVADEYGQQAELLVRGRHSELEIIGSTIEPWAGALWDDLDPTGMDDDGSGDASATKYFSRDELERIGDEVETTNLKVAPYQPLDDAIRTDGAEYERMDESDVQPLSDAEPTFRWQSDDGYEYLAFAGTDTEGVFRREQTEECAADFNGDDLADTGDISAFVDAFLHRDANADLNGDGIIDFADVDQFVQAFLAGC